MPDNPTTEKNKFYVIDILERYLLHATYCMVKTVVAMGLFDGILGKKETGDNMVLEPCEEGYRLKQGYAQTPRIIRVHVFFQGTGPLTNEQDVLKEIIKKFDIASGLAPDALITVDHETMPEIDEYLSAGEIPESLNAFLMSRAMIKGLARGPAEMGKLAIYPFNIKDVKGVLILKEL